MFIMLLSAAMALNAQSATETITASASAPAPASASAESDTGGKRYCVKEAITGSRMARKICKTRTEWQAQGWDPLNDK